MGDNLLDIPDERLRAGDPNIRSTLFMPHNSCTRTQQGKFEG